MNQKSETLQQKRSFQADAQFSSYDFGFGVIVEDSSGWEYTTPGDHWSKEVFILRDAKAEMTEKVNMVVNFKPGSDAFDERDPAYAITQKGVVFGQAGLDVGDSMNSKKPRPT